MDDNLKYRIRSACSGNWKSILQEATKLPAKKFKNQHQPCPLCKDGTDRYRFDDKKGGGGYFCNVCGAGNGVTFLQKFFNRSEDDVYGILDDLVGVSSGKAKITLNSKKEFQELPDIRVLIPAPRHAPAPKFWHYKLGEPQKVWVYKNLLGDVCFYIARFEKEDGTKDVIPMSYCYYYDRRSKAMQYGWRWKGVSRDTGFKRPLYNLADLLLPDNVHKWVILTEGEKACDSAKRMFPELVALTWSGGTKSIDLTDWSPLIGRNIIIWPDNDADGYSAAIKLFHMFLEYNNKRAVKFAVVGSHREKGWDLADAETEGVDVRSLKHYLVKGTFGSLYSSLES